MALHGVGNLAEMEIAAGVFFAAKKQNLDELVRQVGDHHCKMFIGHAGWAPGQLESEIQQGAWKTFSTRPTTSGSGSGNAWKATRCRPC
jgi:putative transcriptional regulator